jgi:hypothetical protein
MVAGRFRIDRLMFDTMDRTFGFTEIGSAPRSANRRLQAMPRWYDRSDDDEDDLEPDEDPVDSDDDDEDATLPCPHCRREIYEESERCPHCGSYLSHVDAPGVRKPWWIIVGVIAGLYVVYRWVTMS